MIPGDGDEHRLRRQRMTKFPHPQDVYAYIYLTLREHREDICTALTAVGLAIVFLLFMIVL